MQTLDRAERLEKAIGVVKMAIGGIHPNSISFKPALANLEKLERAYSIELIQKANGLGAK